MFYQKPLPLISRAMTFEVRERMDARGNVVQPLDEAHIRTLIDDVVGNEAVESIAVCLLHAYANPVHEQAVRAYTSALNGSTALTLGWRKSPTTPRAFWSRG